MRIQLPSGTSAAVAGEAGDRGLVLVPDIMGLRPLFDRLATRLASEWDCRVCAPDLYPGQGDLDLEGRFAAASALTDERTLSDMVEAADVVGGTTVGAIGFCMGGMYVTKAAATGRFDRLVPFYGMIRVPEPWAGPGQGEPLEMLAQGDPTTVMAIVGTADAYTPADQIAELEAAGVTVVSYEGAEHGFVHDPDRPAHLPDEAADAWRRTRDWLWNS